MATFGLLHSIAPALAWLAQARLPCLGPQTLSVGKGMWFCDDDIMRRFLSVAMQCLCYGVLDIYR